jgi:alpha-glucosidase
MFLSLIRMGQPAAPVLRQRIEAVQTNPVGGWPCFALDNHDNTRAASRWTPPGTDPDTISKLTGALQLTLRGTPILYYGQEIGMLNNDPKRIEDVLDVIGKRGWPKEKGRDGERAPMQWNASVNAGFNKGAKTWLPVGPDARVHNVAAEINDPASVLSWYRTLIALRRTHPAFSGGFRSVDRADPAVLAYLRTSPKGNVLVLLNFSAAPASVRLRDAAAKGIGKILAANGAQAGPSAIALKPFGAFVAEVR